GRATLFAAADLGWMAAFDLEKGEWLWRDAPVATIGGLGVAGVGEPILLACFSDGLRGYRADGKPWKFASATPACRSVAVSYSAEVIVTSQLDGSIAGWTLDMKPRFSYQPPSPPVFLALSALGETLYLAQADRQLVALEVTG